MVPENDFHQKDLPTRNAVPTMVQNGPGGAGLPPLTINTAKLEEGTAEETGGFAAIVKIRMDLE